MTESNSTLRRSVHRLAVSAAGVVLLCALYLVKPASTALSFPEPLRSIADQVISVVDVNSVLVATVVLAVVATVRKLSYGIGAILLLCLGANLTCAAVRAWASDAPTVLLPSGHVVAVAALYGSAILVSAPRFRPVVAGLGFALILGVAGAAALVEPISIYGLVASLVVASIWWALASILMLYSPVAAEREALRPDTAAIVFSRHR
ncbi:hypothetical protein HYG77_05740 [Rhodococcus sp. ZPP]|uniref:hypothetical protein n=1 Tax=Rhodococcus sp. ZPP TaxID=2749906 RepID=UPI001AD8859E|nr:hypothetical protein [Rhodococcus sp. ZPP]QTJ65151.1 hypothetical protein HYG77_05740 [Rhodococcus sp. ZPP]